MTAIYDLPLPAPADAERSKTLSTLIRQEMSQGDGSISFDRYMDMVLYHPTLGYYNSDTFTLGRDGDFTTAPEISPIFAKTIARCLQSVLSTIPNGCILELGAGTGRFAGDTLSALDALGIQCPHYYIVEPSLGLRKQQRRLLAEKYPVVNSRVTWLDALPEQFDGVIFANEVLDALPVSLFKVTADGYAERRVTWRDDRFDWVDGSPTDALASELSAIQEALIEANESTADTQQSVFPLDYHSEVNLSIDSFIKSAAQSLRKGAILFVDYGYGRPEYYRPERSKGTLTCFYRHHYHEEPLTFPGLQDITAHVDFTYVAEKSLENGLSVAGFTTQAGFLFENGLPTVIAEEEAKLDTVSIVNLRQAVKTLTMPTEMGEIVKVMALEKGLDDTIPGFRLQDRRRDL